jgi:two-component system LytT family sensor kinase
VESYLVIEKARFEDRLQLVTEIDRSLLGIAMPVFTLQPLVENAVKHGISTMLGQGVVTLRAERVGERVHLTISDNAGNYSAGDRLGLGMKIVEKRIKNLCGKAYGLAVSCRPGESTAVTVILPAEGCRP